MEINIKNVGVYFTEQISAKTPWVSLRGLLLDISYRIKSYMIIANS